MVKFITAASIVLLVSWHALAAGPITVEHIQRVMDAADGRSGESSSTITETVVIDGETRISKVREYAQYALEDGKPVITSIGGHTLVGDTMPDADQ